MTEKPSYGPASIHLYKMGPYRVQVLDGRERRGGVFSHLSVVFIECTRLFDEWVYMEGEDVDGWEHFLIPKKWS